MKCKACGKDINPVNQYCNMECFKARPPKVVIIEREYKTPIKELLKMHKNKSILADLLGISRKTIYNYIKKYSLGV